MLGQSLSFGVLIPQRAPPLQRHLHRVEAHPSKHQALQAQHPVSHPCGGVQPPGSAVAFQVLWGAGPHPCSLRRRRMTRRKRRRRMKRKKRPCLSYILLEKGVRPPGPACGNPSLRRLDPLFLCGFHCGFESGRRIPKSPWPSLCSRGLSGLQGKLCVWTVQIGRAHV